MNEPQIVERVGFVTEKFNYQPYIAYNDNHILLFVFWETDTTKVYEIHIAAPRESILSARKLSTEALNWIFEMGAEKIITNCPKGKISNMAEKVGMKLAAINDNHCYYEIAK